MRIIISLSVMCTLLWLTFREGELASPNIGKTKLSYAPYQNASLLHRSPKRDVTLSMLTVSAIRDRTLASSAVSVASAAPTSMPSSAAHAQAPAQRGPSANTGGGDVITGKIHLSPKLRAQFNPNSTLFIIVRGATPQGGRGPLIASAKRTGLSLSDFPLSYTITQQNSMMGSPLTGEVKVSARFDQDGDALSKEPGDLIGEAKSTSVVGVNPVDIYVESAL